MNHVNVFYVCQMFSFILFIFFPFLFLTYFVLVKLEVCRSVLQIPVQELIQFQIALSLEVSLKVNEVPCALHGRECMRTRSGFRLSRSSSFVSEILLIFVLNTILRRR